MLEPETFSSSSESSETSTSLDSSDLNSHSSPDHSYFQGITLNQVLNKAKFPVLLATLPSTEEKFAVKLFPYEGDKVNRCYSREILFANLRHENICSILNYVHGIDLFFEDGQNKVSYTIMELAPYGDFCDLVMSRKIKFNDKLARTYFRQLVEGVEYLHKAGVAHLDLKLENLLIGTNYNLKICDFDQAHLKGQDVILSRGTESYRAPEIYEKKCQNPEAADIYSLGIILFALKSGGILPYCEGGKVRGWNMYELLTTDMNLFWKMHSKLQGKTASFFEEDFKMLFESMIAVGPERRSTIEQIKNSSWYNGPVYSPEGLQKFMRKNL